MRVEGIAFNLDKKLNDGRMAPKDFLLPEDMDILVLDQHTTGSPMGDILELGKVVGVVQNIKIEDGKVIFDWDVTDDGLEKILRKTKFPEKLLTYSPEYYPMKISDDYPQGEVGMIDKIAITNIPNDSGAITTKIHNILKRTLNWDGGVDMKKEEIEEMFKERLAIVSDIEKKIKKLDNGDLKSNVDKLNKKMAFIDNILEVKKGSKKEDIGSHINQMSKKIERIEKIIEKLEKGANKGKMDIIRNIAAKSKFSEKELEKMEIENLEILTERFKIEPEGLVGKTVSKKDIAKEIAAKYGYDISDVKGD